MSKTQPVTQEHGQRNESRKPEQHRQELHPQNRILVMRGGVGEAPGDDDEVGEGEKGPDCVEEEEVDLAWRHGVPVIAPPVGDCCVLVWRCMLCGGGVSLPYAVNPSTMIARMPCAMRRPRTTTLESKATIL